MDNMVDNLERFALGNVITENDAVIIEPNVDDVTLSLEDYSRFKYGDGAVSRLYGAAIARHLVPLCIEIEGPRDLYVTSSAYKIARPASASLIEPFVGMAQAVTHVYGSRTRIVPFKINRANLTDGDYAAMTAEERDKVMEQNGLTLPKGIDIEDKHVIAIDDIRVTGAHEVSIDALLRKMGADLVTHAYILDVPNGKSNPTLEARINQSSIQDINDLIEVASVKHFAANARFGKRILIERPDDIKKFVDSVSVRITSRILNDAIGDGLDEMDCYKNGFSALINAFAERVIPHFD